ncbi:MAG: hypothetical protein QM761_06500 [Pseudoxanthomonas sp.]
MPPPGIRNRTATGIHSRTRNYGNRRRSSDEHKIDGFFPAYCIRGAHAPPAGARRPGRRSRNRMRAGGAADDHRRSRSPGPGNWEVNIAFTGKHSADVWEGETPLLDINYGVGETIQLKYEVPWVMQHEEDTRSGPGNSMVGVKWRFFDAGEKGWVVSTYPQLEFRNPGSGSVRRGLAEDGTDFFLPLELERDFGSFVFGAEVGHDFRTRGGDGWAGGIVLGREVRDGAELMAEVHGESDSSLGRNAVAVNFGGRFALGPRSALLVSVGRDLHNALEDRATAFGYLALQLATPE